MFNCGLDPLVKWWGFFPVVPTNKVQVHKGSLSIVVLNGELLTLTLGEIVGIFSYRAYNQGSKFLGLDPLLKWWYFLPIVSKTKVQVPMGFLSTMVLKGEMLSLTLVEKVRLLACSSYYRHLKMVHTYVSPFNMSSILCHFLIWPVTNISLISYHNLDLSGQIDQDRITNPNHT